MVLTLFKELAFDSFVISWSLMVTTSILSISSSESSSTTTAISTAVIPTAVVIVSHAPSSATSVHVTSSLAASSHPTVHVATTSPTAFIATSWLGLSSRIITAAIDILLQLISIVILLWINRITWLPQLFVAVSEVALVAKSTVLVRLVVSASLGLVLVVHLRGQLSFLI